MFKKRNFQFCLLVQIIFESGGLKRIFTETHSPVWGVNTHWEKGIYIQRNHRQKCTG